ncbi:MAG: nucleotidyltransferase [Candidatus Methylomirabilota bacterium]|nr:MAG: nucleotidyltransferase [candidate division NC10 bacterium]
MGLTEASRKPYRGIILKATLLLLMENGEAMTVAELLRQCKTVLEGHYGPRFHGLILFGSMARNQASPVSDIDLLVLLNQPFDYFRELRQIIELLYPLQLESDRLISAKPARLDEFEHGSTRLYRNAKREGLRI